MVANRRSKVPAGRVNLVRDPAQFGLVQAVNCMLQGLPVARVDWEEGTVLVRCQMTEESQVSDNAFAKIGPGDKSKPVPWTPSMVDAQGDWVRLVPEPGSEG